MNITKIPLYTEHIKTKENESSFENKQYSPRSNREAYDRIYFQISTKYKDFDPSREVGAQETQGLTENIADIPKEDLIGAMMHIHSNDFLFQQCRENSRTGRLFDKFYLMNDTQQGWNLRLHVQYVRGNGLGGEDPPHYHRWTLASKILAGGYCNRNYQETIASDAPPLHVYNKYQLEATNKQKADNHRTAKLLGKAGMIPTKASIFLRDQVNHFPFLEAHSVQTKPDYFGSTITLAHSSQPYTAHSTAFLKPQESEQALTGLTEIKASIDPDFSIKFEQAIAFLQVLDLQDKLRTHFENTWEQGKKPTFHEQKHQYDSDEPNYVETSLLSAIQIYSMEKEHRMPHREFSHDTTRLLDEALSQINPSALQRLIALNQEDIALQILSTQEYPGNDTLMDQLNREFMEKLNNSQKK